jgi:alpha-L-fucosidase 2
VDLFGPYFRISQWGGHWWNLNVQLTYWPVYPANHLELGENLITTIDENFDALLGKAINATFTGVHWGLKLSDFTWLMHNYWMQYSYDGDWQALREKWVPKAIKIADAYNQILIEEDGKLHIPPVASPEYIALDGNRLYKNTNYSLALIRWLLNSMIEVGEKTATEIPRMEDWKDILNRLVDYPVDENGLMIGSDQSVDQSHRHYSHLLALYPLYQLNPDSRADSLLVDRSVDHWHKIDDGKNLSGYSFTGAASLYAALGRGDDALPNIRRFLTGDIGWIGRFMPNTFYAETHGKSPCFESPMSAASAITELMLQSWGGKIRVFPAMPSGWEQACFHNMRGQGGFLVSASRDESKTSWVQVKSLRGEPCIVKIPQWGQAVQVGGGRKIPITPLGNNEFKVQLNEGEQVLLSSGSGNINAVIEPFPHPAHQQNLFGVKKGENLKEIMVWPEVCPVTGIEY